MTNPPAAAEGQPRRRLGLAESVGVGLASMIGAGLFVAFAPAAEAAGELLLFSLGLAALLTAINAHSATRLAGVHPHSGDTYAYVYGRERLGLPWANLAGWAFVIGKTASCAAMAMTVGVHLWPNNSNIIGVVVVLGVLALSLQGINRSVGMAQLMAVLVIVLTLAFVAVVFISPPATASDSPGPPGAGGVRGVAQGAGFLFFAFVGYARVPSLGGEVDRPLRTIPWAIGLAVGIVSVLYLLVALALTSSLGVAWLAARQAPVVEAAEISAWPWLGPVLRIAAIIVVSAALLALVVEVSRTLLAMSRDRHLPPQLAVLDATHGIPRRAEMLVAGIVIALVVLVDLRVAIGLSSFCVLVYYAVTNAAACTLPGHPIGRAVAALGAVGCLVIALLLPWPAVAAGVVILAMGAFIGWARHTTRE